MKKSLLVRVIGIGLAILIFFIVFLVVKKQRKSDEITSQQPLEMLALQQELDEDGELEKEQAEIINEDAQEDQQNTQQQFDVKNHNFVLDIATTDLSISAPIFDGVTDSSLSRGVGRHVTTALPSEDGGNVVLSGHQWYPGDSPGYKVFEDLDALSKDDEISIIFEKKKFTYKINQVKVVEPNDVSILEQTQKPQLTLYTCYPRFSTEKRLVYVADLIDVTSVEL